MLDFSFYFLCHGNHHTGENQRRQASEIAHSHKSSCGRRGFPQGIKPSSLLVVGGTAEAVPFPKRFIRIASQNNSRTSRSGSNGQRGMPPQNENFNENCSCRGLNMVLGVPKVAFGELGIPTGKSPSMIHNPGGPGAFITACCGAQDTDGARCWLASVVASL